MGTAQRQRNYTEVFYRTGGTGGGAGAYPVTYADITTAVLPTGASFAPDGTDVVDQDTVLFTALTLGTDVGIYTATVDGGGNVTAWTRVVYNASQSPLGESVDGDLVTVQSGTLYGDDFFKCTVSATPTPTWIHWSANDLDVEDEGISIEADTKKINFTGDKVITHPAAGEVGVEVQGVTKVTTLIELKAVKGPQNKLAYCKDTNTIYEYVLLGAAYAANDQDVVITGDSGTLPDSRWIGVAGQYSYYGSGAGGLIWEIADAFSVFYAANDVALIEHPTDVYLVGASNLGTGTAFDLDPGVYVNCDKLNFIGNKIYKDPSYGIYGSALGNTGAQFGHQPPQLQEGLILFQITSQVNPLVTNVAGDIDWLLGPGVEVYTAGSGANRLLEVNDSSTYKFDIKMTGSVFHGGLGNPLIELVHADSVISIYMNDGSVMDQNVFQSAPGIGEVNFKMNAPVQGYYGAPDHFDFGGSMNINLENDSNNLAFDKTLTDLSFTDIQNVTEFLANENGKLLFLYDQPVSSPTPTAGEGVTYNKDSNIWEKPNNDETQIIGIYIPFYKEYFNVILLKGSLESNPFFPTTAGRYWFDSTGTLGTAETRHFAGYSIDGATFVLNPTIQLGKQGPLNITPTVANDVGWVSMVGDINESNTFTSYASSLGGDLLNGKFYALTMGNTVNGVKEGNYINAYNLTDPPLKHPIVRYDQQLIFSDSSNLYHGNLCADAYSNTIFYTGGYSLYTGITEFKLCSAIVGIGTAIPTTFGVELDSPIIDKFIPKSITHNGELSYSGAPAAATKVYVSGEYQQISDQTIKFTEVPIANGYSWSIRLKGDINYTTTTLTDGSTALQVQTDINNVFISQGYAGTVVVTGDYASGFRIVTTDCITAAITVDTSSLEGIGGVGTITAAPTFRKGGFIADIDVVPGTSMALNTLKTYTTEGDDLQALNEGFSSMEYNFPGNNLFVCGSYGTNKYPVVIRVSTVGLIAQDSGCIEQTSLYEPKMAIVKYGVAGTLNNVFVASTNADGHLSLVGLTNSGGTSYWYSLALMYPGFGSLPVGLLQTYGTAPYMMEPLDISVGLYDAIGSVFNGYPDWYHVLTYAAGDKVMHRYTEYPLTVTPTDDYLLWENTSGGSTSQEPGAPGSTDWTSLGEPNTDIPTIAVTYKNGQDNKVHVMEMFVADFKNVPNDGTAIVTDWMMSDTTTAGNHYDRVESTGVRSFGSVLCGNVEINALMNDSVYHITDKDLFVSNAMDNNILKPPYVNADGVVNLDPLVSTWSYKNFDTPGVANVITILDNHSTPAIAGPLQATTWSEVTLSPSTSASAPYVYLPYNWTWTANTSFAHWDGQGVKNVLGDFNFMSTPHTGSYQQITGATENPAWSLTPFTGVTYYETFDGYGAGVIYGVSDRIEHQYPGGDLLVYDCNTPATSGQEPGAPGVTEWDIVGEPAKWVCLDYVAPYFDDTDPSWYHMQYSSVIATSQVLQPPSDAGTPYESTVAPTVNNDDVDTALLGFKFEIGYIWTDTVTNTSYICTDNAANAAKWEVINYPAYVPPVLAFSIFTMTAACASGETLDILNNTWTGGLAASTYSGSTTYVKLNVTSGEFYLDGTAKCFYNGELERKGASPLIFTYVDTEHVTINKALDVGDVIRIEREI